MFDDDMNDALMPWDGEDELAEAKQGALEAQEAELKRAAGVPRESQGAAVRLPLKSPNVKPGDVPSSTSSELPELRAFVRSMGRVNAVMVFKDLQQAGYLRHIAGRYVEVAGRGKRKQYFANTIINGRHALLVTEAGQSLLKELKADGVLRQAVSGPLSEQEKAKRAAEVQKRAEQKAMKKLQKKHALEASQPQALADLDAKIEECIARRTQRRQRIAAAAKATRDAAAISNH